MLLLPVVFSARAAIPRAATATCSSSRVLSDSREELESCGENQRTSWRAMRREDDFVFHHVAEEILGSSSFDRFDAILREYATLSL